MHLFSRGFVVAAIAGACVPALVSAGNVEINLNYNRNAIFNGNLLVSDAGYASISDRGLVDGGFYPNGTPSTTGVTDHASSQTGLTYHFVTTPAVNDTVALTPRTTSITSNTTTFASPILLDSNSVIGVAYNASNNGASVDMVLHFTNSTSTTVTLSAPDWYPSTGDPASPSAGVSLQRRFTEAGFGDGAGDFDGVGGTDNPQADHTLNLIEGAVTRASLLSASSPVDINGLTLDSITFDNLSEVTPGSSAIGIYAVSVSGTVTPEPASLGLLGLGALGLLARRRRA